MNFSGMPVPDPNYDQVHLDYSLMQIALLPLVTLCAIKYSEQLVTQIPFCRKFPKEQDVVTLQQDVALEKLPGKHPITGG